MNKKIASEFAFGIIIFLAVLVGGIFFLESHQKDSSTTVQIPTVEISKDTPAVQQSGSASSQPDSDSCDAHYYEGDQKVHVWPVADASDESDGLVLNIIPEDVQTLPVKNTAEKTQTGNFTVKLVDASQTVSAKIKGATQDEPAVITIKGYAQVCSEPPLVSIEPATVAFKKG